MRRTMNPRAPASPSAPCAVLPSRPAAALAGASRPGVDGPARPAATRPVLASRGGRSAQLALPFGAPGAIARPHAVLRTD
jgi:hypothetical protein